MGLVPSFGFCKGEKDVSLLAQPVLREVPVDSGFGAFIGQVLAPAPDVRRSGLGICRLACRAAIRRSRIRRNRIGGRGTGLGRIRRNRIRGRGNGLGRIPGGAVLAGTGVLRHRSS